MFGPADQWSDERAIPTAKAPASSHAGIIAWSLDADLRSVTAAQARCRLPAVTCLTWSSGLRRSATVL